MRCCNHLGHNRQPPGRCRSQTRQAACACGPHQSYTTALNRPGCNLFGILVSNYTHLRTLAVLLALANHTKNTSFIVFDKSTYLKPNTPFCSTNTRFCIPALRPRNSLQPPLYLHDLIAKPRIRIGAESRPAPSRALPRSQINTRLHHKINAAPSGTAFMAPGHHARKRRWSNVAQRLWFHPY